MKTLLTIFLPSLQGGGAERVMVTLANAFAERGYRVDIVLAKAEGPYLNEVAKSVRVVDLDCSRVLTTLPGLMRYVRKERPSALLSAMGHANVIAVLARELTRLPTRVVVSERNNFSVYETRPADWRKRIMAFFIARAYRRADKIIAVSSGVAEDLATRTKIPLTEIEVVFNPVVSDHLHSLANEPPPPSLLPEDQTPLILAAGRLEEQKGFENLIRAFAQLRTQRPAKLAVLGEGSLRDVLENEVERQGLKSDVVFPGFVDNPFPIMRQANLFVLSSGWEGLPNALIQAMACGTPVVSTDCPSGPAEILENGRWGRLTPVGDDKALAEAMWATLDETEHPDVANRAADFSVEKAVDSYLGAIMPNDVVIGKTA